IMDGLRHFKPQLTGRKFTILTDHKACIAFPQTTDLTDQYARWLQFLQTFDCEIKYLEGKKNVLADMLSRNFKEPDEIPSTIGKPQHSNNLEPSPPLQQFQQTSISSASATATTPTTK